MSRAIPIGLTPSQQVAFKELAQALDDDEAHARMYFIDGDGGTGKSHMCDEFIKWAMKLKREVATCSTTGISANNIINGRTLHSTFRAPWGASEKTPFPDSLLMFLRKLDIVIIDECTMMNVSLWHYIDMCLKKAMKCNKPMGGKLTILQGDWKQILPVVKNAGSRCSFLHCIKTSTLWKHVKIIYLRENMRVGCGEEAEFFLDMLKKVGIRDSEIHTELAPNFHVASLDERLFVETKEELIDGVFPPTVLADPVNNWWRMRTCALLCPTRRGVSEINKDVTAVLPGESKIFKATYDFQRKKPRKRTYEELDAHEKEHTDKAHERMKRAKNDRERDDAMVLHIWLSTRYENKSDGEDEGEEDEPSKQIDKDSYPDEEIEVKAGSILILLKTIPKVQGPDFNGPLFNGIRLQVIKWTDHALYCRILNLKDHINKRVWIQRQCYLHEYATPHHPNRHMMQLPVRLAFAMTINKAQSQTMDKVGLYLGAGQVFSHGHLYTALSRAKRFCDVLIYSSMGVGKVRNVVELEALKDTTEFIIATEYHFTSPLRNV